jgi:hypothetical protein
MTRVTTLRKKSSPSCSTTCAQISPWAESES